MLKIKSNFSKVLVVPNPDVEKQGGNLTVEWILQGIEFAIKKANFSNIWNLYIHLDNFCSNKGYSIISSMAAVVATGAYKT